MPVRSSHDRRRQRSVVVVVVVVVAAATTSEEATAEVNVTRALCCADRGEERNEHDARDVERVDREESYDLQDRNHLEAELNDEPQVCDRDEEKDKIAGKGNGLHLHVTRNNEDDPEHERRHCKRCAEQHERSEVGRSARESCDGGEHVRGAVATSNERNARNGGREPQHADEGADAQRKMVHRRVLQQRQRDEEDRCEQNESHDVHRWTLRAAQRALHQRHVV